MGNCFSSCTESPSRVSPHQSKGNLSPGTKKTPATKRASDVKTSEVKYTPGNPPSDDEEEPSEKDVTPTLLKSKASFQQYVRHDSPTSPFQRNKEVIPVRERMGKLKEMAVGSRQRSVSTTDTLSHSQRSSSNSSGSHRRRPQVRRINRRGVPVIGAGPLFESSSISSDGTFTDGELTPRIPKSRRRTPAKPTAPYYKYRQVRSDDDTNRGGSGSDSSDPLECDDDYLKRTWSASQTSYQVYSHDRTPGELSPRAEEVRLIELTNQATRDRPRSSGKICTEPSVLKLRVWRAIKKLRVDPRSFVRDSEFPAQDQRRMLAEWSNSYASYRANKWLKRVSNSHVLAEAAADGYLDPESLSPKKNKKHKKKVRRDAVRTQQDEVVPFCQGEVSNKLPAVYGGVDDSEDPLVWAFNGYTMSALDERSQQHDSESGCSAAHLTSVTEAKETAGLTEISGFAASLTAHESFLPGMVVSDEATP